MMKQYSRLCGGQKPQFLDSFQRIVQNGHLLEVLAEYNVVQFRHVCV